MDNNIRVYRAWLGTTFLKWLNNRNNRNNSKLKLHLLFTFDSPPPLRRLGQKVKRCFPWRWFVTFALGYYSWWTPCFFWLQATPVLCTGEGNRQNFNCKSNAKVVFILSFCFLEHLLPLVPVLSERNKRLTSTPRLWT